MKGLDADVADNGIFIKRAQKNGAPRYIRIIKLQQIVPDIRFPPVSQQVACGRSRFELEGLDAGRTGQEENGTG